MTLDQFKSIFGALVMFLIFSLEKNDADTYAALQAGQVDISDHEIFGRKDLSSNSGTVDLILASDTEAIGGRNFNSNKFNKGENFAFDQIRLAYADIANGQTGTTGDIASPTIYNVYYSSEIFARNQMLKPTRSAAIANTDPIQVPLQRIPNALLNSELVLELNGKTLFNMSARRVFEECSKSNDGYFTLNVPRIIKAETPFALKLRFGATMPANSYLEYSLSGVKTSLKVA